MRKRVISFAIILAAVVLSGTAAAQEDPFTELHTRLHAAIDSRVYSDLSARTVQEAPQAGTTSPRLETFARQFWGSDSASLQRAVARVATLRPALDPILRDSGVPVSFVALMLVESAGRQDALSPAGARGLWQFMPETARRYGLTVSVERDDRLHVERSTRAAAQHLRDLHAEFASWELAFAAYNAGTGRVREAIARAGSTDFGVVREYLPFETRAYVPAVFAAMELLGEAPPAGAKKTAGTLVYASFRKD